MNVAALLLEQARGRGAAPAMIETRHARSRTMTFSALDEASARGAALLAEAGLAPGDRVLVFVPMSIELYVVLLAIFRAGLVATFVDPSSGRKQLDSACAAVAPQAFIGTPKAFLLRLASPAIRRIGCRFVVGGSWLGATRWSRAAALPPRLGIVPCEDDAPALLTFTSGSTATPKASLRTHGFLLAQHEALAEAIALEPRQLDLTTLPIFALSNLAAGVTTLLPDADLRRPGRIDPAPVMRQIAAYGPTRCAASPAFFERLVEHAERAGDGLDGFTQLYTGGAPVFPGLLERLRRLAPRARLVAVYGSTEAEPIAHVAFDEITDAGMQAMLDGAGLLAGRCVRQIDLRIIRAAPGRSLGPFTAAEFADRCLPAGEPGEIVVHGRHVLSGYLDEHADRETKIHVDGAVWHRTGDAGYVDAAGRLWLLGRADACVNDARGVLYPFAAECAAQRLTGVRRAALLSHRGRRLMVVEPENSPAESLATGVAAALEWARLDHVITVKRIPLDRRHNAKIDYPALRRLVDHV